MTTPAKPDEKEKLVLALGWFESPCVLGHDVHMRGCDDCAGIVLAARIRELDADLASSKEVIAQMAAEDDFCPGAEKGHECDQLGTCIDCGKKRRTKPSAAEADGGK